MRNNVLIILTLGVVALYIGAGIKQLVDKHNTAQAQQTACEDMQSCVRGSITQVDGDYCHIAVGSSEGFYLLTDASERLRDCRELNK